ncbi:unnamed protein product [Brassica oleracea]
MGCLLSVAFGALSSQAPLISGLLRPSGKDSDLLKLILSSSDPLKLTFYRCSSHFLRCRHQKIDDGATQLHT